jgi:Tol biopolymer transport system component
LALAAVLAPSAAAQTKVERKHQETLLAPFPKEVHDSAVVSPDGRRIAYIQSQGGQQTAVFDGKPEKGYERVAELTFSPNSKWQAFAAQTGGQWRIVINGREQPAYARVGPPQFSPNSRRMAYTALLPDGEQATVVEANQPPGKGYERIFEGRLVFSPDSARLVFGARRDNKWYVVVDGQELGPYEFLGSATGLQFSPDGKRLAFAALVEKKWRVIVDGQPQPPCDNVGDLAFSADGRRLAYAAQSGGKWQVILDGKPQAEYSALAEGRLTFSPVGVTLAYVAAADRKWQVIAAGEPWLPFDQVGRLVFSPNGKYLACAVKSGPADSVLLNNRQQRLYDHVVAMSMTFSPDSSKLAYAARLGRAAFAVADGKRYPRYDSVAHLTFSPDNQRLVYAAAAGYKAFTVVDDKEAAHRYEAIWTVPEARLIFDSRKQFHYLGQKDGGLYLVEEQLD